MMRIVMTCFFAIVVLLDCLERAEANALCQPCLIPEECDREPDDCIFGVVRNYCGRKVCAKGPGKRCGGPSSVNGECGEGMHCRCDRCTGCSLRTLDCYLPDEEKIVEIGFQPGHRQIPVQQSEPKATERDLLYRPSWYQVVAE